MTITHDIVTRSTDVGYYEGWPYNFYMDRGQEPDGVGSTVYQIASDGFWFAKSILKTAGWNVVAWSSGAATTGLYSDPFSSSLSMCSDHGWFILKHPESSRSFSIQKGGPPSSSNEGTVLNFHNVNYRIKYSPSGFAITGTLSAKNTPGPITGSDELVIHGGGTDNLPTYAKFVPAVADTSNGGTVVAHIVAQNKSPFGFFYFLQYGAPVLSVLGFDPVISPNAGDTEPFVTWCEYNSSNPFTNIGNAGVVNSYTLHNTWVRRGFADQSFGSNCAGLSYYDYNQSMTLTAFVAGRHPGKKATFLPLVYVTSQSNVTCSYKGISAMLKVAPVTGTPNTPMQATHSVFSLYDVAQVAGGTVIPWFGVRYEAY